MAAMAEEAALNFEDAIELGNFKVNLFPFRECCLMRFWSLACLCYCNLA